MYMRPGISFYCIVSSLILELKKKVTYLSDLNLLAAKGSEGDV